MAPAAASFPAAPDCSKLLTKLINHHDSEPFRSPVEWKAWGLTDYPLIVKHPMDLGTVGKKLGQGKYASAQDFAKEVKLVWRNCMTYNQDGSEYYKLAQKFDKLFEREFSKIVKKPGKGEVAAKPPSADEKAKFCRNVYSIKAVQMGKLVTQIDEMCEQALDKTNPDEIEINVDIIDPETFRKVDGYVKECIAKDAGRKKGTGKRKTDAAAASGSEAKRGRAS